jgi:hypothetical protein
MPGIPLGRASYQRAQLPALTLKNMYYEAVPTQLEDQIALIPRPRLKAFAQAGSGPIRGLYRKDGTMALSGNSGALICKSGGSLYRVSAAGAATLIGAVEGGYRMGAAGDATVVVLTCGTKAYKTTGSAVSQIAMPDDRPVSAVETLASYFLFAADIGRFYWSDVGGTSVDALAYATAENQPDGLTTLKVLGDELWLIGRESTEVWQPTGDPEQPFMKVGGRVFDVGATARDTVQKVRTGGQDVLCWLGSDKAVYRAAGDVVKISDNAFEAMLADVAVDDTAGEGNPYATSHSWNGHDFYVLHAPGKGSFAYDLTTGAGWEEWTSHGRDLFRTGTCAVDAAGRPLAGDAATNQIWALSADQATDGDDPVVFEFSGLLQVADAPLRCDNLILNISAGRTPDPQADPMIELSTSTDEGETFVSAGLRALGRQGERTRRVLWSRLGLLRKPGRIFRWRTTEPVTVRTAKYGESWRS